MIDGWWWELVESPPDWLPHLEVDVYISPKPLRPYLGMCYLNSGHKDFDQAKGLRPWKYGNHCSPSLQPVYCKLGVGAIMADAQITHRRHTIPCRGHGMMSSGRMTDAWGGRLVLKNNGPWSRCSWTFLWPCPSQMTISLSVNLSTCKMRLITIS